MWRTRYLKPIDGKPAIYTIAGYPDIGQVEAREQARKVKRLVGEVIHLLGHKKAEQAKAKRNIDGLTFEVVARQWHRERLKADKWKTTHAAKILKSLVVEWSRLARN